MTHELGHLLGFTSNDPLFDAQIVTGANGVPHFVTGDLNLTLTADDNHLASSGATYDLMNDTLTPGTRKLPSTLDAKVLNEIDHPVSAVSSNSGISGGVTAVSASSNNAGLSAAFTQFFSASSSNQGLGAAFAASAQLLPGTAAHGTITNGTFAISDPANSGFGWATNGTVTVANNAATLAESSTTLDTNLAQTFLVPSTPTTLSFTITAANLLANNGLPPDAFEAALLDAQSGADVLPALSLSGTDAFLNLQTGGAITLANGVTLSAAIANGSISLNSPITVTIDIHTLTPGEAVTLDFDLLGFTPNASSISIGNVQLGGIAKAPLTVQLDPGSDTGVLGDNITNLPIVTLTGITNPNQVVTLGLGGDNFTDATTTADSNGLYTFTGVPLTQGPNAIQVKASNGAGDTVASLTVTRDSLAPTLTSFLVNPGQTQRSHLFFTATFSKDVTVAIDAFTLVRINGTTLTPVTVAGTLSYNSATHTVTLDLGNQPLADGNYELRLYAAPVSDNAGNTLDLGVNGALPYAAVDTFKLAGDVNGDGVVDAHDTLIVRKALNTTPGQPAFNINADLDSNNNVNNVDLGIVTTNLTHRITPLTPAKLTILNSANATISSVNFGAVALGGSTSQTVTLRNDGQSTMTVGAMQLTGPNAGLFTMSLSGGLPNTTTFTLGAGQSITVTLTLTPAAPGPIAATFQMVTNDPTASSPVTMALSATVTSNDVAPTLTNFVVNPGQTQRSHLFFTAAFNKDVTVGLGALSLFLVNGITFTPVALTGATLTYAAATHTATLDLGQVALADGNYELRLAAASVLDSAGLALNLGKAYAAVDTFKLAGDVNGDGVVDAHDTLIVRNALNTTPGQTGYNVNADLNGNNVVDTTDLAIVTSNLTHSLVALTVTTTTVANVVTATTSVADVGAVAQAVAPVAQTPATPLTAPVAPVAPTQSTTTALPVNPTPTVSATAPVAQPAAPVAQPPAPPKAAIPAPVAPPQSTTVAIPLNPVPAAKPTTTVQVGAKDSSPAMTVKIAPTPEIAPVTSSHKTAPHATQPLVILNSADAAITRLNFGSVAQGSRHDDGDHHPA